MKPIILPIIILSLAAMFVVISGAVVESSLNELTDQAKSLPDSVDGEAYKQIELIEDHWNKHKELYSAVIKFDFVYNFSKEISMAKAGISADDAGTYLAAKKSLINILEYIRDVQRLRLDNIV